MGTEKKLKVYIEGKEIVGEDNQKVKSAIGTLSRNGYRLLLTFSSWKDVPIDITNDIKDNTTLDEDSYRVVMGDVSKSWKEFKLRIKGKYFKQTRKMLISLFIVRMIVWMKINDVFLLSIGKFKSYRL